MSLNLERLREAKSVPLERVSEMTKISMRFLRAIEAEEFEKLPGGVFNTSYLRQYAAAVGYEANELLRHYESTLAPSEPSVAQDEPRPLRWLLGW